jgi:hypothetical protein
MGGRRYATTPALTADQVIKDLPVDADGVLLTRSSAGAAGVAQTTQPKVLIVPPTSISAAGVIFTRNVEGYTLGSFQLTGTFVGTMLVEMSDDSTDGNDGTWNTQTFKRGNSTGDSSSLTSADYAAIGCACRWIRFRVSAYTSGTFTVSALFESGAYVANAAVSASGSTAEDSPASGNPVAVAYEARNTNKTAMSTTADMVRPIATMIGVAINKPHSIPELEWSSVAGASGIVNTTTAVQLKAAAGSGLRNYIKSMQISHDLLGGVTELAIRDGAAGTIIWRTKLQTPAKEDVQIVFEDPIKSTANTLLEVVTLTAVTGGVYVNVQGYAAP